MSIKYFVKNLKFIYRNRLKNAIPNSKQIAFYTEEVMLEKLYYFSNIKIFNINETIDKLIADHISLARFGDGEIALIQEKDIPFQKYSKDLAKRLTEVLSSKDDSIAVGLPIFAYMPKSLLNPDYERFWFQFGKEIRDCIYKYIDLDRKYYSTEISCGVDGIKNISVCNYFEKLRHIWANKDIKLICGESILSNLEYDIFDNVASIEYQYAPSINAFDDYQNILQTALKTDRNKLILIILGPTATVLAYDLAKNGFRALDFGHVAKSYDWWKSGKSFSTEKGSREFFKPD